MRYLVLTLLIVGCGHASKHHDEFLETLRKRQVCYKDPLCDSPEKRAQIKDEQLAEQREKIKMQTGVSIEEYVKAFGEPTSKELSNGKVVYWYDLTEPFYATFENNKLVSYVIDRGTINRRSDKRESEIRDQQVLNKRTNCVSYFVGTTAFTDCH